MVDEPSVQLKKACEVNILVLGFYLLEPYNWKKQNQHAKPHPISEKKKMMKVLAEGFEQKVQGKCQVIMMKFLSFHIGLLNGDDLS